MNPDPFLAGGGHLDVHIPGRALKDVFQRYEGSCAGYHQRSQNTYGCQRFWIEVGVEKELGLNCKPGIEAYGPGRRGAVRQLTRARIVGPTRPG
ncbi:hypothetical protein [Micromonospora parva]|uniref:hypothetical protein n=1 Tax=Micromonospora parva TaxID=1464048 RepID=UPI0033ECFFEC